MTLRSRSLGCFAILAILAIPSSAWAAGGLRPTRLTCENLVDPVGIDTLRPRLAWNLAAVEAGRRGLRPTAYEVQVASELGKLQAGEADRWNSGKVACSKANRAVYAGSPLAFGSRSYWRVRVWDAEGQPSEWSKPAVWLAGGLTETPTWKWLGYDKPYATPASSPAVPLDDAEWIWTADGDLAKGLPAGERFFRKSFELPGDVVVREAVLAATGDDRLTLFVNGEQVAATDGRDDSWRRAVRVDLKSKLRPGKNVLAASVGNNAPGAAGLLAKLIVTLADGRTLTVATDKSWKTTGRATSDWKAGDAAEAGWAAARSFGRYGIGPWDKGVKTGDASAWTQEAPSPMFRKTFEVKKPVQSAAAVVCGLGLHEFRINGAKAEEGRVLAPTFTRYDRRSLYVTYDVTDRIVQGRNALGVMLGNGFLNCHGVDVWYFEKAPWRQRPRLAMMLLVTYADGTSERIVTDASWKASTGPVVHDGIRHGEDYDARREMPGWDTPAFDDSAWASPTIVDAPKGVLSADLAAPIRVTQTIRPIGVKEVRPGTFVFDLGQNIAGWVRLKVAGPAGKTIRLRYAEKRLADGSIDQANISPYVTQGPFQTDTYTLKGQGTEQWEPRFTYHGFRWIEVTGFPGTPTLDHLEGRVVHNDFPSAGSFECSHELINTLQRWTLWSYRGNFVGIPTDCPHREKNGWTGDAHLAAEQAMINWGNAPAYEGWLRSLRDEQRPSGELPGIVPTSGWGYHWGNGPAWDSAIVLIPWYLYLYTGDVRALEENYDGIRRYVDYLTSRAKDGISDWGLGDWLPAKTETPVAVTSTSYYYVDTLVLAKTAELLGKKDDAAKYFAQAAAIRKAFAEKFCKPDGVVANGSQTSLSCALYSGFVDGEMEKLVLAKLVADVEKQGNHLDVGIHGCKYLFHALSERGQAESAWKMMTQTTSPSFGSWVAKGQTTLAEDFGLTSSLNHIMFGDMSCWFYRALAGLQVDPAKPGFEHFFVRPNLVGDLKWVKASHRSPYGPVAVAWNREGGKLSLRIEAPPGTSATVFVPAASMDRVKESDRAATQSPGVKALRMESGCAVFEIGSGRYAFTVE